MNGENRRGKGPIGAGPGPGLALALGVALTLALAITAGAWFWPGRGGGDGACPGPGQVAGDASGLGGDFVLVDEAGATVRADEVIAGPTLLYFGYTFCPDICPFDTARNAEATDLLAQAGHVVRPVFISVDPARDTPALLAEFTDLMHPQMLGLTGTPAQVATAARAYRAFYRVADPDDPWTLIDHSTFTYLVFPPGRVAAVFKREADAADIAAATACHIDLARGN